MKQYIDKSTIATEIERRIKECDKLADAAADKNLHNTLEANELLIRQYTSLLDFIDTLEVKEVDLEKEFSYEDYIGFFEEHPNFPDDWGFDEAWIFARHFFELGLMAKK